MSHRLFMHCAKFSDAHFRCSYLPERSAIEATVHHGRDGTACARFHHRWQKGNRRRQAVKYIKHQSGFYKAMSGKRCQSWMKSIKSSTKSLGLILNSHYDQQKTDTLFRRGKAYFKITQIRMCECRLLAEGRRSRLCHGGPLWALSRR